MRVTCCHKIALCNMPFIFPLVFIINNLWHYCMIIDNYYFIKHIIYLPYNALT